MEVVDEDRHFKNPYCDYSKSEDAGIELITDQKLCSKWYNKIMDCIKLLVSKLERALVENRVPDSDPSVYTGLAGIALLYFLLHTKTDLPQLSGESWLNKGFKLLQPTLKQHTKGKRVSFLCGDAGIHAVAAIFYQRLQKDADAKRMIDLVLHQYNDALSSSTCDEVLFGRAGYLYSLLFLEKRFGADAVPKHKVDSVVGQIVASGQTLAKEKRSSSPLMYMWHDSYYLGAAHGLAGIFFMIMRTSTFYEQQLQKVIKDCVDYLITLKFHSGNYPSSLGSQHKDRLVHWCHGAPGYIHTFLQAYKVFGDEVYLKEAISCGDAIWKRGLLKKGYGLCHGVAGNGYAHLMLWQVTRDPKHLYRALKFAEWIFDYGKHGCRTPDRPFSLFEGLAGTIYFLVDLLKPDEAAFPAFY